jgi:tRNA threonylcarbamoyladenosine biosynthesis protein TsaE
MSSHLDLILALPDEAATEALGAQLAHLLHPGEVLALEGGLGAGKTQVARALINARQAAAGLLAEDVPSPSYTLVQTYDCGDTEIWHADLYRLTGAEDVAELGLDAAFDGGAICLIEWPDRMGTMLPAAAIRLQLAPAADGGRIATLSCPAGRDDLVRALTPPASLRYPND